MYRILATLLVAAGLVFGTIKVIEWQRSDAVRDFVREAALATAKKNAADTESLRKIEETVNDADLDTLRELAAANGMFIEPVQPEGTGENRTGDGLLPSDR